MNTVTEIQAALAGLVAAMVEKGVVTPSAQLQLRDAGKCSIHADGGDGGGEPFNGERYFVEFGDTPAEAIEKAREYIAALPSPEEAGAHEYMRAVAKAIDTGKRNGIADEYVSPLRGVNMAMTENLLTHSKEDAA